MTVKLENIKLVIFDLDGVLVDTERISINSWIKAFSRYDYELDFNVAKKKIGMRTSNSGDFYKDKTGKDLPFDEIKKLYYEILIDSIKSDDNLLKKGVVEVLNYLDLKNIKKAVASSSNKERVMASLKAANIHNSFDIIISGDEVKNCKPDPEIHFKICESLGIEHKDAIIIEDSDIGAKAAANAGIRCILIPDLKENPPECLDSCYGIVQGLNDLI